MKYTVQVFTLDEEYTVDAGSKEKVLKAAQDRYCSSPVYDCNEPVRIEIKEVEGG